MSVTPYKFIFHSFHTEFPIQTNSHRCDVAAQGSSSSILLGTGTEIPLQLLQLGTATLKPSPVTSAKCQNLGISPKRGCSPCSTGAPATGGAGTARGYSQLELHTWLHPWDEFPWPSWANKPTWLQGWLQTLQTLPLLFWAGPQPRKQLGTASFHLLP